MPRDRLASRVQLQQLLRHVAHRLLDARLGLFPRGAAELVERGGGTAGVFLNEIEPFEWDEELVLSRIPQFHELLRLLTRRHGKTLQSGEPADTVVDVDDQIADLQ